MTLSRRYQLLVICFILLSVYYSALFAPLCFVDDTKLIFFDAADKGLTDVLPMIFAGGGYYRPLLGITFVFDSYFWMLHESFLHLENVLLHVANALLLYVVTERLVRKSGITEKSVLPFAVALLFGLHPLATESVNWISGRTDPLACLFLLLSFKILLDWFEQPTHGRLFRIQLCFLLACLAKETAVFFVGPVAVLMVVLRARDNADSKRPSFQAMTASLRQDSWLYAAFAVTTIVYFAMRRYASVTLAGRDRAMSKLTAYVSRETQDSLWWDKTLEVFKTIGFYVKKLFIPWPLNFNIVSVSDWYALLGIVALILLALTCWRRRDLIAALLLSAFLVGSSAIMVSVGKLAWTLYGERYLYIPLAFFIPAACLWLYEKTGAVRDGRYFRIIVILLCGASLITTVSRNLIWMDRFALYEDNYKKAPVFDNAIKNYAATLRLQGRQHEACDVLKRLPKNPVRTGSNTGIN